MILGAHLILGAYGFWLPNDPRGSWSEFVADWELVRFGKATKVQTRESVAGVPHDRTRRFEAKRAMKFPAVTFSGIQAVAIANGFARAIDEGNYEVHACSILPEHVHLVARRSATRSFEMMVSHLKAHATRELRNRGIDPMHGHTRPNGQVASSWSEGIWKVFINDERHYECAIRYVERNPLKEGKRKQRWGFVSSWESHAP